MHLKSLESEGILPEISSLPRRECETVTGLRDRGTDSTITISVGVCKRGDFGAEQVFQTSF
jgi:hypothetical protein